MSQHDLHRHLTPAVGEAQHQAYGQSSGVPDAPEPDRLGAREITFIGARDSFYLASLTEAGAPYIQHRGGPVGFLRVALFLMDYPNRRLLKIDGTAELVPLDRDPSLLAQLGLPDPGGPEVERLFRIQVDGYDWNCPQFITPRFTAAELEGRERLLWQRIGDLEAELLCLQSSAGDQVPAEEW
jgi:uncharacterized protein